MSRSVSRFLLAAGVSLTLLMSLTGPVAASRTAPAAAPALEVSSAPLNPAFLPSQSGARVGTRSSTPDGRRLGERPGPQDVPLAQRIQVPAVRLRGALPASYDLRTVGRVTSMKDQGPYGTCWAFASCGSLESCLMPGEVRDFSEDNMVLTGGFDDGGDPYERGGNVYMSSAYLLRWSGPVDEADDVYADGYTPPGLSPRKHVQDVTWIPARESALDNDSIKDAVMRYGAVYVAMGWFGSSEGSSYYDPSTASYYYNAGFATNHGVLIVGWDDGYAAANFATTPPGNGAFIVKNSWGTGWGDGGYFHVSYYDTAFGLLGRLAAFDGAGPTDNYTGIYQYDPLGFVASVGFSNPTAWLANAFTAQASASLSAVGFYTLVPGSGYEIHTGPSLAAMTLRAGGTMESMGYHTVVLPTPVSITGGQPFAVAVKMTTPGYDYPIAIEKPVSDYSSAATARSGQSYVSSTGASWTDLTTQSGYGDANVCLKAYVEPARPSGDTTPPTVTPGGFDGSWHNRPVTVTLTGSDTGSGVACIWYSAGGRPWYQVMGAGAQVTIPAPADHSWDGVNEIQYYGVDNAGNQPGVVSKDCHVMIDTRRPTTRAARRVSVRRGLYGQARVQGRRSGPQRRQGHGHDPHPEVGRPHRQDAAPRREARQRQPDGEVPLQARAGRLPLPRVRQGLGRQLAAQGGLSRDQGAVDGRRASGAGAASAPSPLKWITGRPGCAPPPP